MSGARGSANEQYFDRRADILELRQQLRSAIAERSDEKRRAVIRRLMAFMSQGIDVGILFPDMIMACQTNDMFQKKMVYLYLTAYSESNSELAILVLNSLQKDCADEDPGMRGLAIRSMCSLHQVGTNDIVCSSLLRCMGDHSEYVRRSAIAGFRRSCKSLKDSGIDIHELVERLHSMIIGDHADVDNSVFLCAAETLHEMDALSFPHQEFVEAVKPRIAGFTAFQLSSVNRMVLSQLVIRSEDELFEWMNLLDQFLRFGSSVSVCEVSELFLRWSSSGPYTTPELFDSVCERCATALVTCYVSQFGNPEEQHALLSFLNNLILLLTSNSPMFCKKLAIHYRYLLCGQTDGLDSSFDICPWYIVSERLALIGRIFPVLSDTAKCVVFSEVGDLMYSNVEVTSIAAIKLIGVLACSSSAQEESLEIGSSESRASENTYLFESVDALVKLLNSDRVVLSPAIHFATIEALGSCCKSIRNTDSLSETSSSFSDSSYLKYALTSVLASMDRIGWRLPEYRQGNGLDNSGLADGICGLFWFVGVFADQIPASSELLDALFKWWTVSSSGSICGRAAVICVFRVFIRWPVEARSVLSKYIRYCFDECLSQDVRDLTLVLFRFLKTHGPKRLDQILFSASDIGAVAPKLHNDLHDFSDEVL